MLSFSNYYEYVSQERFVNEDADYEGPELVTNPPIHTAAVTVDANDGDRTEALTPLIGIRIVKVFEDDVQHHFYDYNNIPKQILPVK